MSSRCSPLLRQLGKINEAGRRRSREKNGAFLKKMRSKLNSSTCNSAKEAERGLLVPIISPGMFTRDIIRRSDC
jgi:hypothetical protein